MTGNTTWWGLYLLDGQQKYLEELERSHYGRWCTFLVELHGDAPSESPFVEAARAYRKSPEWQTVPVRDPDELPPVSGEIDV